MFYIIDQKHTGKIHQKRTQRNCSGRQKETKKNSHSVHIRLTKKKMKQKK